MQMIWRSVTYIFHLRVPDHQMSSSGLVRIQRYHEYIQEVVYVPDVKTNTVPVFAQKAACIMVTPCSSGHADSVSSSIKKWF